MVTFIRKYRIYIMTVLLATIIILISRFIGSIDFDKFKMYLSEMPGMFAGVVIASLISYSASTIAWSLCLGDAGKKISFSSLFMYRHVGEMLSAFNPTSVIAGESLKAAILYKKGIDGTKGVSSILLHRVLFVISSVLLMVFSILYLTIDSITSNGTNFLLIIIFIIIIFALSFLVLRFIVHPKLFIAKTIDKLRKKTKWKFLSNKLIHSSYEMNRVTSDYFSDNKGRFLIAFLLCIVYWIFSAIEFYIVLIMMGLDISLMQTVVIEMGVSLFKTIGMVIPAQIGVEEYGNKVMLDVIGVESNEIWLVVTLMRRGRQLFWLLIAGIFAMLISKKSNIKLGNNRNSA